MTGRGSYMHLDKKSDRGRRERLATPLSATKQWVRMCLHHASQTQLCFRDAGVVYDESASEAGEGVMGLLEKRRWSSTIISEGCVWWAEDVD